MEIICFLIKPRTQRNSLWDYVMVEDSTGSDNAGLNSPAAKGGLNENRLSPFFSVVLI
jgi:hypothetical protein